MVSPTSPVKTKVVASRMRLLTHNMLKCNIRGVEKGYPLRIEAEESGVEACDYDEIMVKSMLKKIDFNALKSAATDISNGSLADYSEITEELLINEEFLRNIHHLLFEVRVLNGFLVCPESGRKFPIKDGIPNMLLHEDEV